MTNDQMVAGRFEKLQKGRVLFGRIQAALSDPMGVIQVLTYTKATEYKHQHAGLFTLGKTGDVYVQRGKSRECINWNPIRFGRLVRKSA